MAVWSSTCAWREIGPASRNRSRRARDVPNVCDRACVVAVYVLRGILWSSVYVECTCVRSYSWRMAWGTCVRCGECLVCDDMWCVNEHSGAWRAVCGVWWIGWNVEAADNGWLRTGCPEENPGDFPGRGLT